jgi:Family of unknown function (DUF5906)
MEPPALLSTDEWSAINTQRAITTSVNREIVKVGAVYLRSTSKIPVNDNWSASKYLDTNLQDWIDNELFHWNNVGFNLQQGWVDIDIDGEDSDYNKCIHQAMQHLGIDCRLAFGRRSVGAPCHFLVQLPEEEARSFEDFKRFEPKPIRIKSQKFYTEIRSGDYQSSDAKQTVVPGSIYVEGGRADISVWWNGQGGVAKSLNELTQTTPRSVNFDWLIRAIAFGTILYLIKPQWVAGTRQNTALQFNGWLARVVDESYAMNNSEQLSQEVHCPIDADDIAESLLQLICDATGDEEAFMRKRAYKDARNKLSRNPDAKIPGWPTMRKLLGEEIVQALRNVCIPGTDTNVLMQLVDQYIYNDENGKYIDRDRHRSGKEKYEHAAEDLYRRHKPDTIMIAGKPKEAFKSFEMSKMRVRVSSSDMFPDSEPFSILRLARSRGFVDDDYEGDDASLMYNAWRGWDNKPPVVVNLLLMRKCEEKLDKVLRWLTCDRAEQVQWIKQWLAWIIQHPGDKQQIAWVVVGGQGVGKSFIGNVFCSALFGSLHGMINGKQVGEKFSISPFLGKMFVFADEVKFKSGNSAEEIKLLVRNMKQHGELKGIDSRDYNIFARLMFASNNVDVRIGQADAIDRALFYTKAYTPEFMQSSQLQFNNWTLQHKPFFDEFAQFLKQTEVIEHYMQMFMQMPVDRHQIEDIKWSSSHDHDIVRHNLGAPHRIAKIIIESGWLLEGLDISHPFTERQFIDSVSELIKRANENTKPSYVLSAFEKLGLLESVGTKEGTKRRFKWHIGELTAKFGDAIGVPMESQFTFGPGDYGANTNDGDKVRLWKGGRGKF